LIIATTIESSPAPFRELTPYCFADLIGRMRRGDICERFRPDQGRTLVLRIEMSFARRRADCMRRSVHRVCAPFSVHVEDNRRRR